jgi:hypothetical protein
MDRAGGVSNAIRRQISGVLLAPAGVVADDAALPVPALQ